MGIVRNDYDLFMLLFTDDQVVISLDEQDYNYMVQRLYEEYKAWALDIILGKTNS